MLSRIFWIGLAGIALIAGIAIQDGNRIFSWGDHRDISEKTDHAIEDRVASALEGSFDGMTVTGEDGEEIDVPSETKRAMALAVGRLVEAETDLAMLRIRDRDDNSIRSATTRRDHARAEVDRLKTEIESFQRAANSDKAALREQIRSEIREDVRAKVREAVR